MMYIDVNIEQQMLWLKEGHLVIHAYSISTALNGVGEQANSECTPRGEHQIAKLIGKNEAADTVFVGRVPTGEIYSKSLDNEFPQRDWILSRIVWLSGCEFHKNKGGQVDTFSRYIYIHGTPDDVTLGVPGSHGCIRMRNADIIELFELLELDMKVYISER